MMKRINILIGISLLMGISATSCKKFLDINSSPNSVTSVKPDLLFNYAEVTYATNRSGGDFYLALALAAQTQSDGGTYGWAAGDAYDISTYSTGNTWTGIYVNGGNNLHLAYQTAQSGNPANNAAAAQCKILLAQEVYDGTMLWGDMPYTEAWQAKEIPYPKFDTQKDVLDSLIGLLDEAIAQISTPDESEGPITTSDLFYGGNMDQWKRAANAMKLRIMMDMVDKDPSKAAEIGKLVASEDLLESAKDNFEFPYGDTKGNENPKFSLLNEFSLYFDDGRNNQFFAHNAVLEPMVAQNDPRLPKFFDLPKGKTEYLGVNGGQTANANTATISNQIFGKTAPELILSYQEQLFFQAEIYARGLGVTKDLNKADTYYKKALYEACTYYGVADKDAQSFADSRSLLTVSDPVKEIHLQQWIDLMDRPSDAFTNWRRSGSNDASRVPKLSIPEGAPAGNLIHRWPYPNDAEINPNPNAPKTNPQYYDKLWFEQ